MRAPTGEQYELTAQTPSGDARAIITQVAAGVRHYSVAGIDLTEPFPESSTPPSGAGIVLVPWPNRVKDGVWDYTAADGTRSEQRLSLTEPDRQNAIHGLLRYSPYTLVDRTESSVTQKATIFPHNGYPFTLGTIVRHELVDDGLLATHSITNLGDANAPVAIGAHPYLKIGDVPTSALTIKVAAATHFTCDDRLNLTGEHPVDGTEYDLRKGALVGDLSLDDGWADVELVDGYAEHTLNAPDGRQVGLFSDNNFGYVQVYTSRSMSSLDEGEVAIAIEPMSAPANALNSGRALTWLKPGQSWTASWGIRHKGL